MNWLRTALSSSVGKKFAMAITGLLLCGFLITHLAGNLLLYVGPAKYDEYANALHSNEALLVTAEIGLFALFVIHIGLAISLSAENRLARSKAYLEKKNKGEGSGIASFRPDYLMLVSGLIVLAYLVLHVTDFKLEWSIDDGAKSRIAASEFPHYQTASEILKGPIVRVGYLVGQLFLIVHLMHGVASAFQTLGLNHRKYNCLIKWGSVIFAVVVGLGFMSFVFWSLSGGFGNASADSNVIETVNADEAAQPAGDFDISSEQLATTE